MKNLRQDMIRDLVNAHPIQKQEELADALARQGFKVTQATVSRDIKEMGLRKRLMPDGTYCYTLPEGTEVEEQNRRVRLLKDLLLSVEVSAPLVVVKTHSGSAGTAAEVIDAMGWPDVLGTIAGDNTILLVARSQEEAATVTRRLRGILR